ncbi:hypothetical protein [Moraxella nasicaprae]|uniref:Phage-Barnase-EndoU-ColicinE5/D-RelE like nuclease 3 domain-containing protein n=1 Tax=Moraxella nasicaprae TaxID=2904122 RepID=A0ABY6F4S5_9GAMM|nr:hypothetical protein [Moraxella nasicaprae]UXZ05048.1 hypothetical protein LU297_00915 [Moraxella nasicaprae]
MSEPVLTKIAEQGVDELSPVVGFRDTIIVGHKATRHTINNDVLDLQALEKIIKDFNKPDFELWDTQNKTVLLAYQVADKIAKLTLKTNKGNIEVISGFYVDMQTINAGIAGGEYIKIGQ